MKKLDEPSFQDIDIEELNKQRKLPMKLSNEELQFYNMTKNPSLELIQQFYNEYV